MYKRQTFNFLTLNQAVNKEMKDTGVNPYCPAGYRLPNQRELAVLRYFADKSFSSTDAMMSRTYWIFGGTQEAKDNGFSKDSSKYGFSLHSFLTVNKDISVNSRNIRCVRDVHVD